MSNAEAGPQATLPDSEALMNRVTTTYVGDNRVRIMAGDRSFDVDQRTHIDRPGARCRKSIPRIPGPDYLLLPVLNLSGRIFRFIRLNV